MQEGADCYGGNSFTPKVNRSMWNFELIAGTMSMRLARCPPGFILVRDESQILNDQCYECKKDFYSTIEAIFPSQLAVERADRALARTQTQILTFHL